MSEDDVASSAPDLTTSLVWRSYLREYSELYLRTVNEYQRAALDPEQAAAHWMGQEPASVQTVQAAEERLCIRFPPSLRIFLLTSDGWNGVGGWVQEVCPCEDISWLRDTDWGVTLIEEYSENSGDDDEHVRLLQRSLKVANGEDFWLLDPAESGAGGEWAAYLFELKYGHFEKFAGFAELFHASRQLMERFERDFGGM